MRIRHSENQNKPLYFQIKTRSKSVKNSTKLNFQLVFQIQIGGFDCKTKKEKRAKTFILNIEIPILVTRIRITNV